jgi:hypothetical protein
MLRCWLRCVFRCDANVSKQVRERLARFAVAHPEAGLIHAEASLTHPEAGVVFKTAISYTGLGVPEMPSVEA